MTQSKPDSASERGSFSPLFALLAAAGVSAHLAVAVVAGNRLMTPWSGGGDEREYVSLAQNLLAGYGYTFAHRPTAFRAPGYPIILAGIMRAFPVHWLVALHLLQFVASVLTAAVCGRLAQKWFGLYAGRAAFAITIFMPTLLYFTGEALSECFAALLIICYLFWLDEVIRRPRPVALVILGVMAGLAALIRFNAVPLIPVAIFATFVWPSTIARPGVAMPGATAPGTAMKDRLKRALAVALPCALVMAPWLIHNAIAFHGQALYSTHGGFAAVEGVLMPLGRTQRGETEAIKRALGWGNWDVESDTPAKPWLRYEVPLNNQAWGVTFGLWRDKGLGLVPIGLNKTAAFWLSTDQLMDTHSLSWRNRLFRWAGVAAYWAVLLLAILGWWRLRGSRPDVAWALLIYTVVLVVAHVPLTMNTRLRVPLFDPLLASLSGAALSQYRYTFWSKSKTERLR